MTDPEARTPLQLLLSVQEEDQAADRLIHRRSHLPEQIALSTLARREAQLVDRLTALAKERGVFARRVEELEKEAGVAGARIAVIEERLRGGHAGSFRDQQAMADEVASLGRRRSELEDAELEQLEQLEPFDAELADIEKQRAELAQEMAVAGERVNEAAADIEIELEAVRERRARLAAGLPDQLSATYERLRAKLDGVGAARLVHGMCSGCHLALPATERDRLRHAPDGTVSFCDQCGRILVP